MVVKENRFEGVLYDRYLMYSSTNLIDWKFIDEVRNAFPKNPKDNYEGPCLSQINGLYYLYTDHYLYNSSTDSNEYDGKIRYAVSDDLENWQYMGTVNTQGFLSRHGSVTAVNDEVSEIKLKELFNSQM